MELSPRWKVAPGATGGLIFTGSANAVRVAIGVAASKIASKSAPDRANQSAEIGFQFDAAGYVTAVQADAPLAWYRLGELSGITAADSSGNGHDATYTPNSLGAWTGGTLGATGAVGDGNKAATFNSTTGYGQIGDVVSLRLFTQITLEAWVKTTYSGTGNQPILTRWKTTGVGYSWWLGKLGSNLEFHSSGASVSVSMSLINDGNWHHVAAVAESGGNLILYVDGSSVGTPVSWGSTQTGVADWRVGGNADAAGELWNGSLDEVAIYGTALSAARVTAHHSAGTGGLAATVDFTGAFVRYQNASNYILAKVDHTGAKTMTVIERIAGADNTLFTLPSPGASSAAAIRIEVVGYRLRAWYEAADRVQDRPPDGGATLNGDPTVVGDWGMYAESNAANTLRITRFFARGLPKAVLAPPAFAVDQAVGCNYVPVTLTVSGLSAPFIDWEILPVDPADFPEPYRDQMPGSATSRIVWVRPGYQYDVRVRSVNVVPGVWNDYKRIGPYGSAGGTGWTSRAWQLVNWPTQAYGTPGDVTPPAADDTFPAGINPDYVFEGEDNTNPIVITSNTGHARSAVTQVRPRRTFKMLFDNRTSGQYQLLIDFFDFMQARTKPFNWTHTFSGEQFVLRFDSDDPEITYKDQSQIPASPIAKLTLPCIESPVGVVPAYAMVLNVDPAL